MDALLVFAQGRQDLSVRVWRGSARCFLPENADFIAGEEGVDEGRRARAGRGAPGIYGVPWSGDQESETLRWDPIEHRPHAVPRLSLCRTAFWDFTSANSDLSAVLP